MQYKKIILKSKSGLITPLETDTVLSYVFAYNFEKLFSIFEKFKSKKDIPFLISNGFISGYLSRPIFFSKNDNEERKNNLFEDIENEKTRKDIKKLSFFPIEKEFFELTFNGEKEKLQEKIKDFLERRENEKEISKKEIHYKNYIPRFNVGETNPYQIEDIHFLDGDYVIYVKVFNENDFNLFYNSLKDTFENIGFGKAKSRGYGHFEKIEKKDLDGNEKEIFDYLENLKKEKNLYFVLNNFKPSKEDLENIDLEKSFIEINKKHTKSLSEFNEFIFKGQMNFIKAGSVVYSQKDVIGDIYKSNNSYNFGFIF